MVAVSASAVGPSPVAQPSSFFLSHPLTLARTRVGFT
jgi:hypothetical protein